MTARTRARIAELEAAVLTQTNLVETYRHLTTEANRRWRDAVDARDRTLERALTAETLLAQLHRAADLGEPRRELGRLDVHHTARALGQALAATARDRATRTNQPAPALPVLDETQHLAVIA